MSSSQLIWELTRRSNSFLLKNPTGAREVFSKEPGNLTGRNSYKYSGLANLDDTVGVTEIDGAVAVSVSSKKAGKYFGTTLVKKNARRTIYAAGAIAATKRPDLKHAAKAKASVLAKGISKRKATASIEA